MEGIRMGFHSEFWDIEELAVMHTVFTTKQGDFIKDEVHIHKDFKGVTL
jgi:hypothetical protein